MPNSSLVRAAGLLARRRAAGTSRRATALAAALVAVTLIVTGCGGGGSAAPGKTSAAGALQIQDPGPSASAASAAETAAVGTSLVATARVAHLTVRNTPTGSVQRTLSNPTTLGEPLTFMVLDAVPGWLQVALPLRPNGSSGWVAEADVVVTTTPYRLQVSMSKHRLVVLYRGHQIASHPVGVGKSVTPTPPGTYYLTALIRLPNPHGSYGPYAFGLSAFSNTLTTFAGGPGQLGLHGTDTPSGVGHDVSHGCLRLANTVITQLAHELPLGTPIDIRS